MDGGKGTRLAHQKRHLRPGSHRVHQRRPCHLPHGGRQLRPRQKAHPLPARPCLPLLQLRTHRPHAQRTHQRARNPQNVEAATPQLQNLHLRREFRHLRQPLLQSPPTLLRPPQGVLLPQHHRQGSEHSRRKLWAIKFEPHVYAVTAQMLSSLRKTNHSQAVIISGESGAGKTEANKECLRFLQYYFHRAGSAL